MPNRSMQAKKRKLQKMKRSFPKSYSAESMRVGGYDSGSPYAIKTRKFRAPDFAVMERDKGLSWDDPFPSIKDAGHKSNAREALRARAEDLFTVARNTNMRTEWMRWRKEGKISEFNYVNYVVLPLYRLDLFFHGQQWYWIEEDQIKSLHSRSLCYPSRQRALMDWKKKSIRWTETIELKNT